jgi:hypothetical protein
MRITRKGEHLRRTPVQVLREIFLILAEFVVCSKTIHEYATNSRI